jgi:ferredoxin
MPATITPLKKPKQASRNLTQEIDCGACKPACPVEASFADLDLLNMWLKYEAIDALWLRKKEAARAMVAQAKARR